MGKETEALTRASLVHRQEKRSLWEKVVLLSSAILGFSVTMLSKESSLTIYRCMFEIGWGLFLSNILIGLFLLKEESEFEQSQALANSARKWDEDEMNIPVKSKQDKDKFLALVYLHGVRTTKPSENHFSEYATKIYESNKKGLTSWKMIKNPEKFYSYSHLNIINKMMTCFYATFTLALIFLVLAVVLG